METDIFKNLKPINDIDYLSPEYVYYLLPDKPNYLIDGKSTVLKEQPLFIREDVKIFSDISGEVLGIKTINNKNYLVMQNNYREKNYTSKSVRRKINKITKEEFIDTLKLHCASNLSNNISYLIDNINSVNEVVMNLVVCETSDVVKNHLFKKYFSEIMDMFDSISTMLNIKNPTIIVTDTDEENIESISNLSGSYPDLRIVLTNNKYPYSHPLLIKRYLNMNDALVLDPSDLYYIYTIIKRNKEVLEQSVLISGENFHEYYFITTKRDVLIKDLLKQCNIDIDKDDIIAENSAIRGKYVDINDVINIKTKALIILNRDKKLKEECINCGLCNRSCPQKLNPQLYKLFNKKLPDECIKCNMCSYICPSHIGRGDD